MPLVSIWIFSNFTVLDGPSSGKSGRLGWRGGGLGGWRIVRLGRRRRRRRMLTRVRVALVALLRLPANLDLFPATLHLPVRVVGVLGARDTLVIIQVDQVLRGNGRPLVDLGDVIPVARLVELGAVVAVGIRADRDDVVPPLFRLKVVREVLLCLAVCPAGDQVDEGLAALLGHCRLGALLAAHDVVLVCAAFAVVPVGIPPPAQGTAGEPHLLDLEPVSAHASPSGEVVAL